jgi:hypothetical protein
MKNKGTHAIPAQHEGNRADIIETINTSGPDEAKSLFRQVRERLFNVNEWSQISDGLSATFILTDPQGNAKAGMPAPGDHFRIDIPGPGSSAGKGYDWVRVELVEDNATQTGDSELAIIKVRPSEDPVKQEGVAHFFEPAATSSFIVRREGNTISAEVHGRNEKPNVKNDKLPDKLRNAVIGTAAAAGVGNIQWKNLAKGLLKT